MKKSQHFWLKASRLLAEPEFFNSERERVLAAYPLLGSHGLGQARHRQRISGRWQVTRFPEDLKASRDALRAGGRYEGGIRNTLEYFVEGRVSLSYRGSACRWARRFNGPAPSRRSSYGLKHDVERYLRKKYEQRRITERERYTANGAFVCAALMAGLRAWSYRGSINPDFRLGKPWAIAGLQPEDYEHPDDQRMARFWRWAVQQDTSAPHAEDFISDTVDSLYSGADLQKMQKDLEWACSPAKEVYYRLRREFGFREEKDRNFWFTETQEEDADEESPE